MKSYNPLLRNPIITLTAEELERIKGGYWNRRGIRK